MSSYDDIDVFNNFIEFRMDSGSKHNTVRDKLIEMVGDCSSKKILDLGCGIGEFTKYFSDHDALSVCGIDISNREILYAKNNNCGNNISYMVMDINNIDKISDKFDIVFSDMVFNYIEDFDLMIGNIYNLLNKDGVLIFSMVHPISTASLCVDSRWINDDNGNNCFVMDNYCNVGVRKRKYFGGVFDFYHRRFEDIINVLINNNFELLELCEPYSTDKEYNRPSFLIMKLKKK